MKSYLLASLLLLSSVPGWAQDNFGRNAPTQNLLHVNQDGALELLTVMCLCKPVTKEMEITVDVPAEVDGKKVTTQEKKTVTVCEIVTDSSLYASPLDVGSIKVFETDGKSVDPKSLAKRVSKPTLVVVSSDDKMIAPYYASLFKPGTLIVALPPHATEIYSITKPHRLSLRLVSQEEDKPATPPNPPANSPAPTEGPAEERPAADLGLGIKLPASGAPMVVYARVPEAGKINLRSYTEWQQEREIATEILKNGVPETVLMKQLQKGTRSEATQLEMSVIKAMTADGKPLSPAGLADKLKTATAVFTSSLGQPVDPFWLVNVKPGVVVLTVPQGVLGGYGYATMPVMMPSITAPPAPGALPPPPVSAPESTPEPAT